MLHDSQESLWCLELLFRLRAYLRILLDLRIIASVKILPMCTILKLSARNVRGNVLIILDVKKQGLAH